MILMMMMMAQMESLFHMIADVVALVLLGTSLKMSRRWNQKIDVCMCLCVCGEQLAKRRIELRRKNLGV
jgi:hypothetical protein